MKRASEQMHNPEELLRVVRDKINQNTKGGAEGMLNAFRHFRRKGSDNTSENNTVNFSHTYIYILPKITHFVPLIFSGIQAI